MNRRGFLAAMLAAGAAPAFVRYGSLMVPKRLATAEPEAAVLEWVEPEPRRIAALRVYSRHGLLLAETPATAGEASMGSMDIFVGGISIPVSFSDRIELVDQHGDWMIRGDGRDFGADGVPVDLSVIHLAMSPA